MNAERETNRLPLRAGAMLLFAVAIVFLGLGWHSAVTSGEDPEAALQAAQSGAPTSSAAAPPTTSSATSSAAAHTAKVCVYNASDNIAGLADDVIDALQSAGFSVSNASGPISERNYPGGFTLNTIVYSTSAQESEAQQIADALRERFPTFELNSRDSLADGFSPCENGIAVVAVTK
ncbi:MAG: LytR C-terminal domain-containing protein [Gordonia sp. (in: high G+C Gram-positive bacteria)]